jgi:hypothetical protein
MAGHFRRQLRSMRGEVVDFAALASKNESTVALGNARMNAKGDLLGDRGFVLKTQEQIEAEWAAARAKNSVVVNADIKSENMFAKAAPPPMPTPRAATIADVEFPSIQELVGTGAITPTPKRKIVEKDE